MKNRKDKVALSKHLVWDRADALGFEKSDLREKLGLSIQALYYRFKTGWAIADAELLAKILRTKVEKIKLR